MVFQDPMTSFNPVYRIGAQIVEAIRAHREGIGKREGRGRAIELLDSVGIADAARRVDDYPHEFSGGMRQRAMIAMALALEPEVLIADEPTTALDVTIQAQILRLLEDLNQERGLATILITHDLGVVAEVADRVLVMYAGRVVEEGTLDEIFYDPQHPYTWGLLGSLTRLDRPRPRRLPQIRGAPPSLLVPPKGCAFRPRCPHEFTKCTELPDLEARLKDRPGHGDRCWLDPSQRRELRQVEGRIGLEDPTVSDESLLEVTDLVKHFPIKRGLLVDRTVDQVRAVDGVSLTIGKGETLGLVGESGCGKSTLCRTILHLLKPTSGSIRFEGHEIGELSRKQMRPLRREMQMIFQDPYASLNPRKRIGQIVGDPLKRQGVASGARPAPSGLRTIGAGRPRDRALQPLSTRVLRRTATAGRHRAGLGASPEAGDLPMSPCLPSTSRSRPRSSTCSPISRMSSASPTSSSPTTSAWSAMSLTGSR